MKISKQLLVISSIATGMAFNINPVHAQQITITPVSTTNTYNINKYSTRIVKLNDKNDIVKYIQSALNLYFGAGLVEDGIYGIATEYAVKDLQKKLGLNVDGIFGPRTANALLNYITNCSLDNTNGYSPIPIQIQKDFVSLGYNLNINGDLSSYDTMLAVKKFQSKNGLNITGKVDKETLNLLKW